MQDSPRISNNYFDGLAVTGRHKAVFFIIMIAYFCEQMDNWNFGFIAPALMHNWGLTMRVGQTAEALLREGKRVEVSQAPLSLNPIAQASGGTSGFVKVVWSEGRIAGIAAVGAGVSHLVMVALLLIRGGYTAQNLHEVMFAHPTLDEIVPMAITAPKTSVTLP